GRWRCRQKSHDARPTSAVFTATNATGCPCASSRSSGFASLASELRIHTRVKSASARFSTSTARTVPSSQRKCCGVPTSSRGRVARGSSDIRGLFGARARGLNRQPVGPRVIECKSQEEGGRHADARTRAERSRGVGGRARRDGYVRVLWRGGREGELRH